MDNIKVTPKIPVDTQSYYPNLFFLLTFYFEIAVKTEKNSVMSLVLEEMTVFHHV